MDKISIIVPCYNEEEVLPLFYNEITRISNIMKEQYLEVIFVNDGSRDNTLKILKGFASKDKHVKYISFSRNFGKESAMYAGLEHADGNYVVFMDADMQDPPSLLPEMYDIVKMRITIQWQQEELTEKESLLFVPFLPENFIN